jgi:hypothetical protein
MEGTPVPHTFTPPSSTLPGNFGSTPMPSNGIRSNTSKRGLTPTPEVLEARKSTVRKRIPVLESTNLDDVNDPVLRAYRQSEMPNDAGFGREHEPGYQQCFFELTMTKGLWLAIVHITDLRGLATRRDGVFVGLEGGKMLTNYENYDKFDSGLTIYDERGFDISFDKLKTLQESQANAATNKQIFNMALMEYAQLISGNAYDDLDRKLKDGIAKMEIVKVGDKEFAECLRIVEGLHIGKTRGIGDVTGPVHVAFGQLMWRVVGYLKVTDRVFSQIQIIEKELATLYKKNLTEQFKLRGTSFSADLARCLESMITFQFQRNAADRMLFQAAKSSYEAIYYDFLKRCL